MKKALTPPQRRLRERLALSGAGIRGGRALRARLYAQRARPR